MPDGVVLSLEDLGEVAIRRGRLLHEVRCELLGVDDPTHRAPQRIGTHGRASLLPTQDPSRAVGAPPEGLRASEPSDEVARRLHRTRDEGAAPLGDGDRASWEQGSPLIDPGLQISGRVVATHAGMPARIDLVCAGRLVATAVPTDGGEFAIDVIGCLSDACELHTRDSSGAGRAVEWVGRCLEASTICPPDTKTGEAPCAALAADAVVPTSR